MNIILHITIANLRRGRSQALILLVFTIIAALLLNLSLLLMLRFGDFFDRRSEILNAPHYVLLEEERFFSQAQMEYLERYPGVTEVETEVALALTRETVSYSSGKIILTTFLFLNSDVPRNMNHLTLIEGSPPQTDNQICIPYMFKAGGGYDLGDSLTFTSLGTKLEFIICGFTEEIMFGSISNPVFQTYLSASGYYSLSSKIPLSNLAILRVRMQEPTDSTRLRVDFAKRFFFQEDAPDLGFAFVHSQDYDSVRLMRTMMSVIFSIVLVLFAASIVLVSLLVVRFMIHNAFEENMTNIGALKAVGYTGSQLLKATILQFCSVTVVGVVAGIALSYTVLTPISNLLKQQTALRWSQGFDLFYAAFTFGFISVSVLTVTWMSAKRVCKLHPLTALRHGIVTHSFKKNYFPLEHARGSLTWLLALKAALQSKGQMIMLVIIIAQLSFAVVASVSVYSNMVMRSDVFSKLFLGEAPDAIFYAIDSDHIQLVRDYVENSGETRNVFYYHGSLSVMVHDIQAINIVAEDYNLLEGSLLYDGRYPKHANEIAISGLLSQLTGKNIGETVRVICSDKSADYLVVGLIQFGSSGGLTSAMTFPGVWRVQYDYQPRQIYVYMTDNSNISDFVQEISERFETVLHSSLNMKEAVDAQIGVYGDIFRIQAIAIVAVTVIVVTLVISLTLRTAIMRSRRELGIQKALGFTTFQLMNRFTLYYIPATVLGVCIGYWGGIVGFNPIFVLLTQDMGIMTASMPAPVGLTIVTCSSLVLLTYVFSMLIAWRIRKFGAYTLMNK